MKEQKEQYTIRQGLLMAVIVLALCSVTAVGGYFLGRQVGEEGASPGTEVAAQPGNSQTPTNAGTEQAAEPTEPQTEAEAPTSSRAPAPADSPAESGEPAQAELDLDEADLDLFWEVWRIVQRDFDGDLPTDREVVYSLVQGSLETLNDQYTAFITPEVAARLREQAEGSFEGIGAYVEMSEQGFLTIVRPIPNQPAAVAGLQPGDVILAVDGEQIVGRSVDEAIALVRGPRGTAVILTVGREGVKEPFDVTIVRQLIEIPVLETQMLPENIAYVHLTTFFNRNTSAQLEATLAEMLAQEPRALIFDLRDNGGGFLDEAVAVADLFLPGGVVLYERNRNGLDQTFEAGPGQIAEGIPMVVLVNAGSASASEIVAGALKDHGRAILIGETTFGKGSVQQTYTLTDGSELRVTIARWYTPNNVSISDQGIAADIEVTPSPLVVGGPEDTQLQRAVEYILSGE